VALLVWNLVLDGPGDVDDAALIAKVAGALKVPANRVRSARLLKRSLDARKGKPTWRGTCRVEAEGEARIVARGGSVRAWTDRDDERYGDADRAPETKVRPDFRVVVVGAGPAGLFAALRAAEAGAEVVLLERGDPVERRVDVVNAHWRGKSDLDPESNVVFGEGGAGTFSDGKIYTRRRDGELGVIFRRLIDFGADPGVLSEGWAHLGTDKVREILPRFRARLAELGVDVRFGARAVALLVADGAVHGVALASGEELRAAAVVVAAGHSARDTNRMMVDAGAAAVARPIAIGARIEHPQELVDVARYHGPRGELPPASYRLAHNGDDGLKVRSFCMCPGGMIVPASNHVGRTVVNGMSFAARRAFWANSAVVVEVEPEEYGGTGPLAGYDLQDAVEIRCFDAAGGADRAPAQRVDDFLAGRASAELPRTSYPRGVVPGRLDQLLPGRVARGMVDGIRAFARTIPGFDGEKGILVAPESRTTSPVRFLRDDDGQSTTLRGLYPVGEGAGYGGGIVSCALDGWRVAGGLLERARA
jgi:uncharacterized FAD-dependent dehydrogenase